MASDQISPDTETLIRRLEARFDDGLPYLLAASEVKPVLDALRRPGVAQCPDLWRPIDTVPRDGSKIMLTGVTAGGHRWFMDGEVYAKGWIGGSAVNRVPNYWRPIPKDFALPASPDTSTDRTSK